MSKSNIEWTNETWNPTTGCNKVSRGCKHCYAEVMHKRLMKMQPKKYSHPFLDGAFEYPEALNYPLTLKKPSMIFVDSMSDLFHKNISLDYIQKVFKVMNDTPKHTYQVLTKRADRLFLVNGFLNWTNNIWMGVSVEDSKVYDRIIYLQQIDAKVKFLSCEPLVGPLHNIDLNNIDWVICGGESGNKASPLHPDWVRSLRDQCKAAGVSFFFKQWGAWQPRCVPLTASTGIKSILWDDLFFSKVGKHKAGNLLDGKQYLEFPATFNHG